MATLMRHEAPGMTSDQFEAVFAPLIVQLKSYPGFITHASSPVPGGYQVTELWESQESHERWLREVIAPAMQRIGVDQTLPPPQYLTVAHLITR